MAQARINPALFGLAQHRVWTDLTKEKQAFQPPGGAPPMDPAAGGMPPGGAPPMDPAAGGMPPGGAPPMDPAMAGGAPPMDPSMMGSAVDPATGMPMPPMPGGMPPMAAPQQKMKPEQMMQMIDFRLYNMQQQLTAIMNHAGIDLPPGAVVMPPGQMSPTPEAALPGGPQDPTQQQGVGAGEAGGGGPGSAIAPIDPMQGASPELAAAGGKTASASTIARDGKPVQWGQYNGNFLTDSARSFLHDAQANVPDGYEVRLVKAGEGKADISSTDNDVDETEPSSSAPNSVLNVPGAPGVRPQTQSLSAGGSKDPKSKPETEAPMTPANKAANFAHRVASGNVLGTVVDYAPQHNGSIISEPPSQAQTLENNPLSSNASALAQMMRQINGG